jgi:hypothetical protein
MHPLLARLIVFALLAVDWAADPSQGTSPLSPLLGSTETVCPSLAYRQEALRQIAAAPSPLPGAPAVKGFHYGRDSLRSHAPVSHGGGHRLNYLFVPIRC